MKFRQTLTYILIFTISLIPTQLDRRIAYAIILYAVVLLPVLLKSLKERLRGKDKSTIFFLIFLAASTLSTVFSINFGQSITQLLLLFAYFVIFVSVGRIFESPKSRLYLALAFLLVTFLLSLLSLYNTAILHLDNLDSVGASFMWVYFGHNHLSALLIFAIPLAIYFAKAYSKNPKPALRFLFPVLSLLLLVAFYFTFARASQVSLLAAIIFVVIIFELIGEKLTILVLAFALAAIGIILASSATPTQQLGFTKYETFTKTTRTIYWQQAIENAEKYPFLGTGPDTFRFINRTNDAKTLKTLYTHNFFLQTLSDSGLIAAVAGIALIASVLINVVKSSLHKKEGLQVALTISLIASTINSLFDFDWQLPVVFLIFWVFSGLFLNPQNHE